jgi:signal transduction histidine kinase
MEERSCLILTQYRENSDYNDFIGKYYHFPATSSKNYLGQFDSLPIEVVYYEPDKHGKGVFFGYGKIVKPPFIDKKIPDHYFVEISDFKSFSTPVFFKNDAGEILEKLYNSESYNYNNAVRKVKPNFLDELCLDGGIQLNFKADSHLVQVLGEQLIASERVGILELIKNSIDAGASYCNVIIEKVPNITDIPETLYKFNEFDGPVIVIEDNGSGMSKEQIEMGWLRPASTLKTTVKERLKRERVKAEKEHNLELFENYLKIVKAENKGRIPLGEKGVGRFATHRLGRKLIIKTKIRENDYEFVLKINWDDFNLQEGIDKDLDSVKVTLTRETPSRDYGSKNSGTQLIIFGGREGFELTEDEIKKINKTILRLNSPNPRPNVEISRFKASFVCPQVKDLDEEITYLTHEPVFRIYGIVDEFGNFEYDHFFESYYGIPLPSFEKKNQKLQLKTLKFNNSNGSKKSACGAFYIHIDVWYRDLPWLGNSGDEKQFKEYLDNYGGISIYRDGINVFPAEEGTKIDWLKLSQRHSKQTFRMSYYHMMGNIELDQSVNIDLVDKTNREGMINNRAFDDLTELVKAIVYFAEVEYIGKRDELNKLSGNLIREPKMLRGFPKQSAKLISNISTNYDVALDQYKLFENIHELGDAGARKGKLVELSKSLNNLEGSLKQIQEVQEMLTEQAGFGLGIAVALHEISKTTTNFYYGVLEVLESGKFEKLKLEDLKDTSLALESEILRLSPLRALRNEEPIQFNVSKSVSYVHSVFKRRFKTLNIDFDFNQDQDFEIKARYGALNQILTNLFDNSCYWMDKTEIKDRKIRLKIDADDRAIIVADNGEGIHDSILPYLFQPGYSLKFPPSGLGLYVCKHYMNLMKKRGDIYLAKERDRIQGLNGAQFFLDFSRVIMNDDGK